MADWRISKQLSTSIDVSAVSSSYARGNENNQHQGDGVYYLGSGNSAGYAVVNLGGDYQATSALKVYAQIDNVFDRNYYTAAQLGATAFDAAGKFVARPFAGPVVNGERPLLGTTFFAAGAPRAFLVGVRYSLKE